MAEENKTEQNENKSTDSSEKEGIIPKVGFELSKVATNPKQSLAIIIVGVLLAFYIIYSAVTGDDKKKTDNKKPTVQRPKEVTQPALNEGSDLPSVLSMPNAPKIQDPTAPPPVIVPQRPKKQEDDKKDQFTDTNKQVTDIRANPPKLSENETLPPPPQPSSKTGTSSSNLLYKSIVPKELESPEAKQKKARKLKSNIILLAGTPPRENKAREFMDGSFHNRGDMHRVLGKGKVLYAVIDEALNSDFVSEVKATIMRDVYSESGKVILIPKGSKIFGSFSAVTVSDKGRMEIKWNRIDLRTGYTLNFAGEAVDSLGRKGTEARLDKKIKEKFSNVILSTALNVAFASAVDAVVPPPQTQSSAALAQNQATGLQTSLAVIISDSTKSATDKMTQMCTTAQTSITDITSPAYLQIQKACNDRNTLTGTDDQKVQALFSSLTQATTNAVTTAAAASQPSKSQQATEAGVKEFSTTLKDVLGNNNLNPTITLNQGEKVRIYVTKDYLFPKDAIKGTRLIQ